VRAAALDPSLLPEFIAAGVPRYAELATGAASIDYFGEQAPAVAEQSDRYGAWRAGLRHTFPLCHRPRHSHGPPVVRVGVVTQR
jgi:hypothetical protein